MASSTSTSDSKLRTDLEAANNLIARLSDENERLKRALAAARLDISILPQELQDQIFDLFLIIEPALYSGHLRAYMRAEPVNEGSFVKIPVKCRPAFLERFIKVNTVEVDTVVEMTDMTVTHGLDIRKSYLHYMETHSLDFDLATPIRALAWEAVDLEFDGDHWHRNYVVRDLEIACAATIPRCINVKRIDIAIYLSYPTEAFFKAKPSLQFPDGPDFVSILQSLPKLKLISFCLVVSVVQMRSIIEDVAPQWAKAWCLLLKQNLARGGTHVKVEIERVLVT